MGRGTHYGLSWLLCTATPMAPEAQITPLGPVPHGTCDGQVPGLVHRVICVVSMNMWSWMSQSQLRLPSSGDLPAQAWALGASGSGFEARPPLEAGMGPACCPLPCPALPCAGGCSPASVRCEPQPCGQRGQISGAETKHSSHLLCLQALRLGATRPPKCLLEAPLGPALQTPCLGHWLRVGVEWQVLP